MGAQIISQHIFNKNYPYVVPEVNERGSYNEFHPQAKIKIIKIKNWAELWE